MSPGEADRAEAPVAAAAPGLGSAAARARSVRGARARAERARLALVGVVLVVLGVLGLLLGTALPGRGTVLTEPDLLAHPGHNPVLSALLGVAAGLVLVGLGGLWLYRSLRRTTAPDLKLVAPEGWGAGTIVVRGAAVAEAARTDAEGVAGVASARARLRGTPTEPVLVLDLVLRRDADLATVWAAVEQHVLAPARTTVERAGLPASVHVEVAAAPSARPRPVRVA